MAASGPRASTSVWPPGTYRVADPFGVPFEITLPANWQLKTLKEGDTEFAMTLDGESYPAWIVVDLIENVFADPCKSASGPIEPPVAADVGSIARALTRMAGYKAGPVADVEIGGHTGKSDDHRHDRHGDRRL